MKAIILAHASSLENVYLNLTKDGGGFQTFRIFWKVSSPLE
jgi:hypothetical protein